jgi:SAM-dependent methyltransferase
MPDGADQYLFDNDARQAGDRFDALGALFDPVTFRHLDDLGIGPGQRCWEVGAGGGSVVRWMADRVGPSGFVWATDLDVRWLETDLRHPNVRISRHDLMRDDVLEDRFEVVHERLVLVHIPETIRAVERMVSALQPGGWLLVEDFDSEIGDGGFVDAYSDVATLSRSIALAMRTLLELRGADIALGSKLPHLLRSAGLTDVRADAYKGIECGDAPRELIRANVVQVRDQLVERGLVAPDDLDRYIERLQDPSLRLTSPTLVSAWGRRPARSSDAP